jgi:hypothetical protein
MTLATLAYYAAAAKPINICRCRQLWQPPQMSSGPFQLGHCATNFPVRRKCAPSLTKCLAAVAAPGWGERKGTHQGRQVCFYKKNC